MKKYFYFAAFGIISLNSCALVLWASTGAERQDFEMVVQGKHTGKIEKVAFSPDGRFLASGDTLGSVKLWNMEGRLLRNFDGDGHVAGLMFTPGGDSLVAVSRNTINVWKLDGTLLGRNPKTGGVSAAAFSQDGRYIATIGGYPHKIKLWDIYGKFIRDMDEDPAYAGPLLFTPDGRYLISGTQMRSISGERLKGTVPLASPFNPVSSMAISRDGKRLVSVSMNDGAIWIWKGFPETPVKIGRINSHRIVNAVDISPDGRYIAAAGTEGTFRGKDMESTVKLWDFDGKLIREFKGHADFMTAVAFSSDGKQLASGSVDRRVLLWDLNGANEKTFYGHSSPAYSVAVSQDGKNIFYGSGDNTVRVFGPDGGLLNVFRGHGSQVLSLALSPDGKRVISAGEDGEIILWTRYGQIIWRKKVPGGMPCVAFSPDGSHVLSTAFENAGWQWPVYLWDINGTLQKKFYGHSNRVFSLAYAPDGSRFVSGAGDNTVKIWDPGGGLLRSMQGHEESVTSVAFDPSGRYVLSEAVGNAILWDNDGNIVREFKGKPGIGHARDFWMGAAFSPDGKYIAIASKGNQIKLFGLDGALLKVLKARSGPATSLGFSPDGRHLVSGSSDGTVKYWNIGNGEYYSFLSEGYDWVMYSPDGYFDSSRSGGDLVNIVNGLVPYGIDQFSIVNNRPDLILERVDAVSPEWLGYYNALYQKRLKKAGIEDAGRLRDAMPPEARITGLKTDGKFAAISFTLRDNEHDLKRYNIYVDGVPLFGLQGRQIDGRIVSGNEKLELCPGKNKIELSVTNDKGVESLRALTYASYDGKERGDLYYIGFGASNYKDPSLKLNYADKDVRDLGKAFSGMTSDYDSIHIKQYLNADVTVDNVRKAKEFLKDAKTIDTVILFVAGHGGYDRSSDPKYYYLPYDADQRNLSASGIEFSALEDILGDIRPRKKLLLMDTCESGELEEEVFLQYYALAEARGITPRTFRKPRGGGRGIYPAGRRFLVEKNRFIYNDISRRFGVIVFSSSRGGEMSYESSSVKNGFFTRELLEAILSGKADKNGDGKVDSNELNTFVSAAVAEDTGDLQHPTIDRDNLYQKLEFRVPGK